MTATANATHVAPLSKHPAKYSDPILQRMAALIRPELRRHQRSGHVGALRILDPFAGVGRIHRLHSPGQVHTRGVEIEAEWAACHHNTDHADALAWMEDRSARLYHAPYDIVATSPCYGNRMADHHDAKDGSDRRSYRHDLGHMPTEGSSATLPWGPDYWWFHASAYQLIWRMLRPGGLFLLNVSDFVRAKRLVNAVDWHDGTCWGVGFTRATRDRHLVPTARMRKGQNHQARADNEVILAFRRPGGLA